MELGLLTSRGMEEAQILGVEWVQITSLSDGQGKYILIAALIALL